MTLEPWWGHVTAGKQLQCSDPETVSDGVGFHSFDGHMIVKSYGDSVLDDVMPTNVGLHPVGWRTLITLDQQ